MDMNEQQPDPQITYENPMAYAAWLRTKGVPPAQVYDMIRQRFGEGKSPEQRAKEQAKGSQAAGLAQAGGTVGGALLAQQAMNGFSGLGSLFGGGGGATGVAQMTAANPATLGGYTSLGGSGAGATGASTLSSVGSVALPVAAVVAALSNAWETGGKDILRGRGDRADWTNQGINMIGGAVPNIALRMLGKRSIGAMMKSGKSNDQAMRDDFRGLLKEQGIADENYGVKLADGSTFNIGLDGKTKYQNVGKNVDGKTERNAWDVDYSNNLANFAVGKIDPLIRGVYGTDGKRKVEQYTGMLVNAALSNAKNENDVLANIKSILGSSEFGKQFNAAPQQPQIQRPGAGQVARVSPGMYMNDQGRVSRATTMRQALEQNYGKSSNKGKRR